MARKATELFIKMNPKCQKFNNKLNLQPKISVIGNLRKNPVFHLKFLSVFFVLIYIVIIYFLLLRGKPPHPLIYRLFKQCFANFHIYFLLLRGKPPHPLNCYLNFSERKRSTLIFSVFNLPRNHLYMFLNSWETQLWNHTT